VVLTANCTRLFSNSALSDTFIGCQPPVMVPEMQRSDSVIIRRTNRMAEVMMTMLYFNNKE